MEKFRKKPIVVEAVQITDRTFDEPHPNPEHIPGVIYDPVRRAAYIRTPEGEMRGDLGDWIIRGVAGELYPCKPDIFAATYEPVQVTARFDPAAAWRALPPAQQQTVGIAAMLLSLASAANSDNHSPRGWEHAEFEAWAILAEATSDYRDYPEGPDLAAIGIRACRQCGCTTEHGCVGGCWWVAEDLCSACAPSAR